MVRLGGPFGRERAQHGGCQGHGKHRKHGKYGIITESSTTSQPLLICMGTSCQPNDRGLAKALLQVVGAKQKGEMHHHHLPNNCHQRIKEQGGEGWVGVKVRLGVGGGEKEGGLRLRRLSW